MSFCNVTAGIGGSFRTDGNKLTDKQMNERTPDGQTDVEVKIVI